MSKEKNYRLSRTKRLKYYEDGREKNFEAFENDDLVWSQSLPEVPVWSNFWMIWIDENHLLLVERCKRTIYMGESTRRDGTDHFIHISWKNKKANKYLFPGHNIMLSCYQRIPPRDCLYFKESPSKQFFNSIGFGVVHNQVYYLRRSPDFFQVQTQENQEERFKFFCLGVLHEEDEENNFRDNIICFIKARFQVELEKNKLYVTEWCKNTDFNELDYDEKWDLYLVDRDADFEEEESDSDDEVDKNNDLEDEGLNKQDETTDNSDLEKVDDKEEIDGTDEEEEEEQERRLLYRVRLADFLDLVKTDAVKKELIEYKCGEVTKQATCVEISSLPSIRGDDGQLLNIKEARKNEVSINWFRYVDDCD